jgi:molecular chaperone IbpA
MTLYKEVYGNLRPLTIGFDEVFSRLDQLKNLNSQSFPPYNIIKNDDESFSVELAVAGFSKDEITITREDGSLLVEGVLENKEEQEYLHKGITGRNFKRSFALAEDVEVEGATHNNGILTINLRRIIPDEKKPQTIEIQ